MNDYLWENLYRSRSAELQDIAAMDRLAAQAAPASALRRYAASRGGAVGPGWAGLAPRLRQLLHTRTAGPTAGR